MKSAEERERALFLSAVELITVSQWIKLRTKLGAKTQLKGQYVVFFFFGEEIQTQDFNIHNINEAIIQTQTWWFFSITE